MTVGTFDIARIQDPAVRSTLERIREHLDIYRGLTGDPLDAVVTFRDLVDGGLANVSLPALSNARRRGDPPGGAVTPTFPDEAVDLTPPPKLTDLVATTGAGFLLLDWTVPYSNPLYDYTEVWRATSDDRALAERLAISRVGVYSDVSAIPGTTYYYWIRAVSPAGVEGPFNAIDGVPGVSGLSLADPNSLLGQLSESHLVTLLNGRIDLIDTPTTGLVDRATVLEDTVNDPSTGLATKASVIYVDNTVADEASARATAISQLSAEVFATSNLLDLTAWRVGHDFTLGAPVGDSGQVWDEWLSSPRNSIVLSTYRGTVAEPMWRVMSDATLQESGFDVSVTVDPTKAYRVVVPMRKSGDLTNGTQYLRLKNLELLDGTPVVNADYFLGDPPALDEWYVAVGVVQPAGYAGADSGLTGLYDAVTGEQVNTSADRRFTAGQTLLNIQAFLYNVTIDGVTLDMARPRCEVMDGTEPPVTALPGPWGASNISAVISQEADVRASVDGALAAEYTVKVQAHPASGDPVVAGFGLSIEGDASGAMTSDFAVLADRFTIAHPTLDNPVVPFAVVGGTTYILNALIQDAAITNAKIADLAVNNAKIADLHAGKINTGFLLADRIETGSIDSKIANIDTAVITSGYLNMARIEDASITTAKIGDAQVDTLQIAGRSVTFPVLYESTATVVPTTLAAGTEIASITVDVLENSAPVLLDWNIWITGNGGLASCSSDNQGLYIWLLRDGVTLYGPVTAHVQSSCDPNENFQAIHRLLDDAASAGLRTYSIRAQRWTAGDPLESNGFNVYTRSFVGVEYAR